MRIVKAVFGIIGFVVLLMVYSLSYSIIFLTLPVWCWFGDWFRENIILEYMQWANDSMGEFADKIDDIINGDY